MLILVFDFSQDLDFLIIVICVFYVWVFEFEVYFEGFDFKFYVKFYFFRLIFFGRIVENGSE